MWWHELPPTITFIFVQAYDGDVALTVRNRTPNGFEVHGPMPDGGVEFSYRIVAKRKGFERMRLEPGPATDGSAGIRKPR